MPDFPVKFARMLSRHHEVSRLEGFSDAVFAIALALLVVSLEVPKTMDKLEDLARGFIPFALMFAMVSFVWWEHNKFFRRYGLQDAWTAFLNAVLLFVVLFYVYPLKFLTTWLLGGIFRLEGRPVIQSAEQVQTLMLLYSSGVVLIFGTFTLLYRHAWSRRAEIGLAPDQEISLRFGLRAHVLSGLLGVVSIALIAMGGKFGFFAGIIYFLMGPLHAWNGYEEGKAQARLGPAK
jgi:uncharacterized membrane protein